MNSNKSKRKTPAVRVISKEELQALRAALRAEAHEEEKREQERARLAKEREHTKKKRRKQDGNRARARRAKVPGGVS